ncbi:MAG TPA: ROK family transcriptional regulator [Sphingobium sp.]|uniref:ROK family transcriptional regulator n=1 Tax=Sphingobium sp. TaxID=1912891 RepID=UPI002ED5DD7B
MHLFDLDYSKLRALKLLRRSDGLSRVELADALHLNKATITALTADLLRRQLVVEAAPQATGRGRPRTQLSIYPGAAYAISLYPLAGERASLDIVDLRGERIHNRILEFRGQDDLEALPARCAAMFEQAIAESAVPRERIRHAGLVLPAPVDHRRGIVHSWPFDPKQRAVAVAPLIAERLGMPVTLDNRATVIARAEHWFGTEGERDNFSMVALLELGMNGARYCAGQMQIGYNGMTPDFSHVKIAFEDGRPCFCGGSGCLGSYASAHAILTAWAGSEGSSQDVWRDPHGAFSRVVQAARAGEERASSAFAMAGKALGTAIAGHINEHDPGRILVVAAQQDMLAFIEADCFATIDRQTIPALRQRTSIDFRTIEESVYWKGAAALALEALYAGKVL